VSPRVVIAFIAAGALPLVAGYLAGRRSRPPVPDVAAQVEMLQRRLRAIEVLHCEAGQILVATCEPADVRSKQ